MCFWVCVLNAPLFPNSIHHSVQLAQFPLAALLSEETKGLAAKTAASDPYTHVRHTHRPTHTHIHTKTYRHRHIYTHIQCTHAHTLTDKFAENTRTHTYSRRNPHRHGPMHRQTYSLTDRRTDHEADSHTHTHTHARHVR
jgi:hypothetical protein